jgi:single-strand DNA-binding protein
MRGLNKAFLIGNIGHEPELRTATNGTPVLKLNVATPSARKVNDAWVDSPDWHRLTFFGKTAEYVARTAHKGDLIAVECVIRPSKWTDREQVTRYDVSLVVDRLLALHSRSRPSFALADATPVDAVSTTQDADEQELDGDEQAAAPF